LELFVKLLRNNSVCRNSKRDMSLKHVAYIDSIVTQKISFKGVAATSNSKTKSK